MGHRVMLPPTTMSQIVMTFDVTLWDGSSYKVDVEGRSRSQDFALLKLRGCDPARLKPVEPSSKAPRIKDRVFTIGFPLYCDMTVTNGFISCVPKNPTRIPPESEMQSEAQIRDAIQLKANINCGNSGGPLYDSKGCFIGVMVACFPNSGIGYAIPLKIVTELVERFIQEDMEAKQLEAMKSLSLMAPSRHELYGKPSRRVSETSSSKRYDLSTPRRTPPAGKAQPELVSYNEYEHLSVEVNNGTKQVQYSRYQYS